MASKPDATYCLLGARSVLQQLQEIRDQIPRVRHSQEPDSIHDLRVASRRLRTGLSLFRDCLPAAKIKGWKKRLRKTTRRLGQARDLDVQIDFLRTTRQKPASASHRPALEHLLLVLGRRRNETQAEVIRSLDRLEKSAVLSAAERAAGGILARRAKNEVSQRSKYCFEQAREHVSDRLEEMLSYEPFIYRPERHAEHHAMRIAAKHLRYTLEYFQPLFNSALDDAHAAAREIQTRLGEMHDCNIWVQYLDELLRNKEPRNQHQARSFARIKPGLLALQAGRTRKHAQLYRKFLAYWRKMKDTDLWGQVIRTLARMTEAEA